MLGFSEEEMLSKHCVDFSPREDAETDWALFQQLRAGAIDHYCLDKRYFRKDGSLTWGRLSISVLDRGPSPLVVALVEDITERKQFEKSLLWRLEFERLISDLSTTFISLPENDVDTNIGTGLARVGKFLGMSRITIFEFLPDHLQLAPSYAWRDPEVGAAPPTVNTNSLPWWRDQILSGRISLISQLSDLPEEASAEKEYFRQRGVVSAASIPLRVSGGITGAIAFVNVTHQVSWNEDLVSQLKVIGDIFCNALKRKRVTEALLAAQTLIRESEERFRLAMSNVASGLYTLDLQGRVTYVNPAAERMFGWTNAELLGKNMHEMTHYKHPDGTPFPLSDCPGLKVLQTGIGLPECEDRFIRKDGTFFPAVYSSSPLKRDQEVVGIVVGFRDDTERREAARIIRERENELLEAQRGAHVGSWHWEINGDVVTWSPELYRIADRDPSSNAPSYKEHAQLYTPDSWSMLSAAVDRTLQSGASYELDLEMVRPDGTTRWITARGEVVRDLEDRIVGLRGTVQDITERKLAEEALSTVSQKLIEAQEQERRIIARELHDDINQRIALAAIRMDGLRHNAARSAEPLRNGLEEIQTALTELSRDIQTLSHRLHSSKLEQLGLNRAAESFCREFSRQHGVKIDFSSENVPRDLPAEIGLCLFRILQESLQNAAKHSGSQDLRVSLTRRSDDLQLTVSDLGKGFDPDKAVKAEGIGLASMKERMKLVNGELSVRTQRNHGTTISARVTLKPSAQSAGTENARKLNSERDSLEPIAPKSAGFSETRGAVEHKRHA
jgi:PAS domain S-box-containing protein